MPAPISAEPASRASRVSTYAREEAGEAAEKVQSGEMPLSDYLLAHADARLTAQEKETFVAGLQNTFASNEGGESNAGELRRADEDASESEEEHDDD